ncbi:MAG: hypothetical protein GW945_03135 [Candidatus Pacebacteria bacterium]|nr:hypothetical protein [Candidatus Paceibacterota bacterium]
MQNSFSEDLKRLQKNQQFLTIIVLLFVCMIFWLVISLFSTTQEKQTDASLIQLAKPLNPTIDRDAFALLEKRQSFSKQELESFPIYKFAKVSRSSEQIIVPITTTDAEIEAMSETPKPKASTAATTSATSVIE